MSDVKRYSVDSTGRAWACKEGTYILASDYDALRSRVEFLLGVVDAREARLAEEVKNKKEFERDWLAACDELCNTRSRLAEATMLMRSMRNEIHVADFGDWNLLDRIDAFLASDSASGEERQP